MADHFANLILFCIVGIILIIFLQSYDLFTTCVSFRVALYRGNFVAKQNVLCRKLNTIFT